MADEQVVEIEGLGALFDPENFVTTTALNGRRGVVQEAEFIRHNYGGKSDSESTALKLVVTAPELEKPRTMLIACGALRPSSDGKTPSLLGPYVVGQVDKGSNIADFLKFLKASGFPYDSLGKKGASALIGASFTFRAFEKKVNKEMKAYDVPAEFHGFESADAKDVTTSPAVSVDISTLAAEVGAAVLKAVAAQPTREISRSQLSIRVGPLLANHPQRAQALGLLLKDDFLAGIPGIKYDKKTVSLSESAATDTASPAA